VYDGEITVPARVACARAGIVTFGKNNFAYTKEFGSFVILYTVLVDKPLEYDEPTLICDCPDTCNICIESCPTKAIKSPGKLLPQNCLLFNHMIPHPTKENIRNGTGTYIHGCDICQNVCPRNKAAATKANQKDSLLEKLKDDFDLERILLMDERYYAHVIYPIMHNYIRDINYFRRNAAFALGNTRDKSHIPALSKVLANENSQVRDAAQWAITKLESNGFERGGKC
jgi:epoxyqueuosine reductase